MPKVVFLPHYKYCPLKVTIEAKKGDNLVELALKNGIDIPHECELSCACTTCHVVMKKGLHQLIKQTN